jgi:signal transduction histidine kinase
MLYEFLNSNREELISRCKSRVAQRHVLDETPGEIEYGIPLFLTQLTEILHEESSGTTGPGLAMEIARTAGSHGNELLRRGFTAAQIVHNYGDLCQAVTELAIEQDVRISNSEFRTLNRCLDDAIADAVSEFAHERDLMISDSHERTLNECLGFLAHEFRNLTNTSMLALEALKRSDGGITGSAGAILDRSLKGMENLCARALVDVRLRVGIPERRERVRVAEFVEEAQSAAMPEATGRGLELIVSSVDPDLIIDIDRHILAGALTNLLQNAFKFTRSQSRVLLKAFSSTDRVLIEVEDECGGLPEGNVEDLFLLFEQRSSDRSGIGLGLGMSRRGVEVNGGTLYARNLPDRGCVFTIDLPMPKDSAPVMLAERDVRLTGANAKDSSYAEREPG